jgi:hypothetical protein
MCHGFKGREVAKVFKNKQPLSGKKSRFYRLTTTHRQEHYVGDAFLRGVCGPEYLHDV